MKQMAEESPDTPWLYYCYYVAFESSDFPFASYMPAPSPAGATIPPPAARPLRTSISACA